MEKRNRRRSSEEGSAFLTAMIFLVVLLGLGAAFLQSSVQEMARASRARKETRALALAEAGLDYAAWRLYNETPASYPITYTREGLPEGSFSAIVSQYLDGDGQPVADTLQVVSTGASQGWTSQVKVIGHYMVNPGPNNPVFDSALFSDSDLTIKGTANIIGAVHANGNMTIQGNSATIQGDASAVGWISDASNRVQGTKTPNAARKSLPTVDVQYYRSKATQTFTGPHTFSGTTTLDGIVYVDGDVTISGQVQGKGVIVASGTIRVQGSATLVNPAEDEFALISTTKIQVRGNSGGETARVEGVLYAHSVEQPADFVGTGTAEILGAVVADVITANGNLSVEYKAPTVELPGATGSPIQLDTISWRRLR